MCHAHVGAGRSTKSAMGPSSTRYTRRLLSLPLQKSKSEEDRAAEAADQAMAELLGEVGGEAAGKKKKTKKGGGRGGSGE